MITKLVSDTVCAGLELEYEGIAAERVMEFYNGKFRKPLLGFCRDGSLRPRQQNTEIKFSGPLSGPLIEEALSQIHEVLTWHRHRVSWRCGMHVHIDCRGIDFAQAYRAAVLTALIEPVLFAWDGTGRQENKFCQSISDSVYAYCVPRRKTPILTKYASLNLKSLFERSTIELRFGSSTKDMNRVRSFINIGLGLRAAPAPFESGAALMESVLSAPNLAAWFEANMHPLMARELVPVAKREGLTQPNMTGLTAALTLCEYERGLAPRIIGGR